MKDEIPLLDPEEQYLILAIEQSSVTARGFRHRTTIPTKIFKEMQLKDKDKLVWTMLKNGKVVISKSGTS